jgi:phage protein U
MKAYNEGDEIIITGSYRQELDGNFIVKRANHPKYTFLRKTEPKKIEFITNISYGIKQLSQNRVITLHDIYGNKHV